MGTVNKPYTFVGDTKAKASEVNSTFDTLYNVVNGSIDENNINMTRTEFKTALLDALKTVDGTGSGLEADLLDGKELATIESERTTEINTAASSAETDANSYTDTHEGKTTGIHGVGTSTVESVTGSQAKVDTHEEKANPHSASVSDTDLTNHSNNGSAHHTKYTNTEAVSAVNAETSLSVDVTGNANTVDGYDIQKNGTDGAGIINFKT